MFLLIDRNGRIVEDDEYNRMTFDTAEEAAQYALVDFNEFDWMVVKFIRFT